MPSGLGNNKLVSACNFLRAASPAQNKEIESDFPAEFAKHYFVAAYLYANISAKDGPVALIETDSLMFSVSLCSSRSQLGLPSAFESDHRRLHANFIISNLVFL